VCACGVGVGIYGIPIGVSGFHIVYNKTSLMAVVTISVVWVMLVFGFVAGICH